MKIKAKLAGDVLKCKLQLKHEMTTAADAQKSGGEANYITNVTAKVGDRVIMEVSTSQFVSKNPQLKFQTKANGIKSGDIVEVTWTDKSGKTKTESGKVK